MLTFVLSVPVIKQIYHWWFIFPKQVPSILIISRSISILITLSSLLLIDWCKTLFMFRVILTLLRFTNPSFLVFHFIFVNLVSFLLLLASPCVNFRYIGSNSSQIDSESLLLNQHASYSIIGSLSLIIVPTLYWFFNLFILQLL